MVMTKKKHYNNFCNENDLRYNSREAKIFQVVFIIPILNKRQKSF